MWWNEDRNVLYDSRWQQLCFEPDALNTWSNPFFFSIDDKRFDAFLIYRWMIVVCPMQTVGEWCKTDVKGANHHAGDVSQEVVGDFVRVQSVPCSSFCCTNPLQRDHRYHYRRACCKSYTRSQPEYPPILAFTPERSWQPVGIRWE